MPKVLNLPLSQINTTLDILHLEIISDEIVRDLSEVKTLLAISQDGQGDGLGLDGFGF